MAAVCRYRYWIQYVWNHCLLIIIPLRRLLVSVSNFSMMFYLSYFKFPVKVTLNSRFIQFNCFVCILCFKRNNELFSSQALFPKKISVDVNRSHAKMVVFVRAIMEVSDAFAPKKAKTGVSMGERPARLHFQAVMTTSARTVEFALPCLLIINTLIDASATLALLVLNVRFLLSSHLSRKATCT